MCSAVQCCADVFVVRRFRAALSSTFSEFKAHPESMGCGTQEERVHSTQFGIFNLLFLFFFFNMGCLYDPKNRYNSY